jgi:hypothetical protein
MHRSGPVHRVGVELEQAVLVRVSALVSARSRQGTRWRNFEPAYIALELRAGDPTAAADVHRMQFANLHEGVDGRATDSKDLGGLFRRQQEGVSGQHVAERLRLCMSPTVEERPSANLQYRSRSCRPAKSAADGRREVRRPDTAEVLKVEAQYKFGAPVMWARRR